MSLDKYNSTKVKGVQLQNKHAPFEVQNLHHEDVTLMLSLEITPEPVFHSLMQFGARKTWPYATP
jgi:hypothetical protein